MSRDAQPEIEPRILAVRLRETRLARGLTQAQAAAHLGLARTTLVAIEKAERRIRSQELLALAALYGREVSELLQRGDPDLGFATRLRSVLPPASEGAAEILPWIAELEDLCADYVGLEGMCGAPLRRRYPAEYEVAGSEAGVVGEDVATTERQRLGLGDGPLLNLREILEAEVGLRIFQLRLPRAVSGIYAFSERYGGCIAVNVETPPFQRRLDLTREYGRFVIARSQPALTIQGHYQRRPVGERLAESFASAFLLPASSLRRRYLELTRGRRGGITQGDLGWLAHFYAVPAAAIVRRFEELRLVPPGTLEGLRRTQPGLVEPQQPAGNPRVPVDDELLTPRYVALAVEAWQRAELSEGQLARILRTDRLGARETVERLAQHAADKAATAVPFELGAPLLRAASG